MNVIPDLIYLGARLVFSKWGVGIVLVVAVLLISYTAAAKISYALSPWSSASKVRQRVLKLTPMGSSIEKVRSALKSEHWPNIAEMTLDDNDTGVKYLGVRGTYAIHADLGQHFGFPCPYGADAYWGFDKTNKMIDLNVRVSPLGI